MFEKIKKTREKGKIIKLLFIVAARVVATRIKLYCAWHCLHKSYAKPMGHVSYFSELTSDATSRIERNANSSIFVSSEMRK